MTSRRLVQVITVLPIPQQHREQQTECTLQIGFLNSTLKSNGFPFTGFVGLYVVAMAPALRAKMTTSAKAHGEGWTGGTKVKKSHFELLVCRTEVMRAGFVNRGPDKKQQLWVFFFPFQDYI